MREFRSKGEIGNAGSAVAKMDRKENKAVWALFCRAVPVGWGFLPVAVLLSSHLLRAKIRLRAHPLSVSQCHSALSLQLPTGSPQTDDVWWGGIPWLHFWGQCFSLMLLCFLSWEEGSESRWKGRKAFSFQKGRIQLAVVVSCQWIPLTVALFPCAFVLLPYFSVFNISFRETEVQSLN